MNKKYFDANKELWDEFAKLHYETESDDYSVKSFLEGQTTLKSYELKEMGNVKGKSLLHLQCHSDLIRFHGQEKELQLQELIFPVKEFD